MSNTPDENRVKAPARVVVREDLAGIPLLGDACDDVDRNHRRIATLLVDTTDLFRGPTALTRTRFEAKIGELVDLYGAVLVAGLKHGQFQAHVAVWDAGSRRVGRTQGGVPLFVNARGEVRRGHLSTSVQ